MQALGFAILCVVGLFLYLDGTGAGEAGLVLAGFAAFYVLIAAALMRD